MTPAKTILIIEDHEESRFLYSEILRGDDFEVVETEHGKEALDYLASHPAPDLVLMDLTFPEMTAKEFVDQLRSKREHNSVPLLVLSGQHDIQNQAEALGASAWIKKPFDMDPFIETVRKLTR